MNPASITNGLAYHYVSAATSGLASTNSVNEPTHSVEEPLNAAGARRSGHFGLRPMSRSRTPISYPR
jgi:hypothetical protein